jgi:hypothetical protein
MNRWYLLMVVMAFPAMILAQTSTAPKQEPNNASQPYQPAVPAPSMTTAYGGYPGYVGGTTAAGSALNGMASMISANGSANLSTSAAAINMTEAQKNSIQNQQLAANTYFEMRESNRAAQERERGPHPTAEQIARIAKDGVPKPLSPSMMDPVTGRLAWPAILQIDRYAKPRTELDEIFAKTARYGEMDFSDQTNARQAIQSMFAQMKSQIQDFLPADYMASRNFLQSLNYYVCKNWLD